MRPFNLIASILFVALLTAPVVSLSVWGYQDLEADRPHWDALSNPALYAGPDRYRSTAARQMIENTPFGAWGIALKSKFDYWVLGAVNTPKVISGIDGWLFYKPGTMQPACWTDDYITLLLDSMEVRRIVAEGAGVDLRFAISPDKAVVHPEKLGRRGRGLAGCKLENARHWRRLARAGGYHLIDHLEVLEPHTDERPLYYRTDTHWNETGLVLAFRQLYEAYLGTDPGPSAWYEGMHHEPTGDLAHMLGLGEVENFGPKPASNGARQWNPPSAANSAKAFVLHDSFYKHFKGAIEQIFPNGQMIRMDNDNLAQLMMQEAPQYILINSIEREFPVRVTTGMLAWGEQFGKGLMSLNEAAANCDFAALDASTLKTVGLTDHGTTLRAGQDSNIFIPLPANAGGKPCIRIRYDTDSSGYGEFFIPLLDGTGGYRGGRRVEIYRDIGRVRDIRLVLPARFAGAVLRFDPVPGPATISNLVIETGIRRERR